MQQDAQTAVAATGCESGLAGATAPAAQATGEGMARRSVRDLTPRELGARGEDIAAGHLRSRGWEILERNWRCGFGEVDIVAREDATSGTVVLVEVKTRLALDGREDPVPELAVDREKRERYRMCALCYLSSHRDVEAVRFDVMALTVVEEGGAHLRHLLGAYSLDS